MQGVGKIKLQDSSGGNYDHLINKKFRGRIPFCIILVSNIRVSKIIKFPTTTVLRGIFINFLHVCSSPHPESLTTSQFPVFTLYASKSCVRGAGALCPGREWSFDRVAGNRAVAPGYARAREKAASRERCLEMCLLGGSGRKKKFICRCGSNLSFTLQH